MAFFRNSLMPEVGTDDGFQFSPAPASVRITTTGPSLKESGIQAASVKVSCVTSGSATASTMSASTMSAIPEEGSTASYTSAPKVDAMLLTVVPEEPAQKWYKKLFGKCAVVTCCFEGRERKFEVRQSQGCAPELVEVDYSIGAEFEEVAASQEDLEAFNASIRVSAAAPARPWVSAPGFSTDFVCRAEVHEMLRNKLVGVGILSGQNAAERDDASMASEISVAAKTTAAKPSTIFEEEEVSADSPKKWYQRAFGKCGQNCGNSEEDFTEHFKMSAMPSVATSAMPSVATSAMPSVATSAMPAPSSICAAPSVRESAGVEDVVAEEASPKWYQRVFGKCGDRCIEKPSVSVSVAPTSIKCSALEAASVKLSSVAPTSIKCSALEAASVKTSATPSVLRTSSIRVAAAKMSQAV